LDGLVDGIDLSWLSATFVDALIYLLATLLFPEGAAVSGRTAAVPPTGSSGAVGSLASEGDEV
jgi:hypothetical protein